MSTFIDVPTARNTPMKWIDHKCVEQERGKPASQPRRAIVLCNKERPTPKPRMPARLQQGIFRLLQPLRSVGELSAELVLAIDSLGVILRVPTT